MNITEVREAQETIRKAERELELIVKEYLESAETIKNTFNHGEDFTTDFEQCGLHIKVFFACDDATGYYFYRIDCKEYGISNYEPPTDNNRTAQGTVNVEWNMVKKDGKLVPEIKTISLQKYYE